MHELLLFASIPAHQHHDLLQQLAGLTAMQPRYRLERRLLFKAYRKPGYVNTRIGGSQDLQSSEMQRLTKMLNGGMYYTQVVGPVHESDFGSTPPPLMGPDAPDLGPDGKQTADLEYDFDEQPWRLEFRDIPEAGTRSAVTSRVMSNATLPRGDVILPMSAWGYSFVTEYVLEGHVFVYNDIVIFMHRVLNFPDDGQDTRSPRRRLPPLKDMTPLDKSGGYVLQTAITVQDGANPETMKMASQHLFGLREQLKSVVRLEQADRLALDTRVK
ncbi:hypothetical protein DTO027B5_8632 [Paecilomyces variotii]|nr:hypothetical protein DTO169C6_8511 [Paecilomyces variotii]KAJ9261534.1 hypothetical protein DTO195F2_4064 [Paecilomyces variotii]KAJ9320809.1 hypothetical protein DTO027B3_8202 [Paecilomyces variotii]KAJ9328830.1 hypothetical protein DTO027B5_8632 [Paecilomyces variotii]KAJ9351994.1 hypothetical protein DTO027B9_6125 [Paecilomyces variotii]